MKYNFIETNDIVEAVLQLNNIKEEDLNKKYDFIVKDEVFLNFKEKLIENKDLKFLIVGDYDCDGICATAIIKKLFMHLNISSNFYIPSRIKDGYGLNDNIVKMAKENNFDALFLVDNGIVCKSQIDLANSLGIKVFIIDHHEYKELPNAISIIHSNLVNEEYSKLSAGGLAFVFSLLFYEDDLSIALGGITTLSDMMPVIGFNRYLIKKAMSILEKRKLYQLNLLNDNETFDYQSLSFNVIPKINAISRMEPMGNPNHLVEFLLSDEKQCRESIERINYINEKRKLSTKDMSIEAKGLINNSDNICIVSSINFKEGLCGLIANRLIHEVNKPCIVLSLSDGYFKGSGRSVDGLNLYEALSGFKHYDSYGGHEGAVGVSFKEEYYSDFVKYVNSINFNTVDIVKDVFLVDQDSLTLDLQERINSLRPFGTDFKEPIIAIKNNNYKKYIVSYRFPKYIIRNDLSAISFNESLKDIIPNYLIGYLRKDTYHKDSLSFSIEDLI